MAPRAQHHFPVLGEFACIAKEVDQDLSQPKLVGLNHSERIELLERKCVPVLRDQISTRCGHLLEAVVEIDRMKPDIDVFRVDLGHVQDIRDQRQQVAARVVDGSQFLDVHRMLARLGVLQQDFAIADDGIERGPKLVTHLRQEDGLGFIGAFSIVLGDSQLGRRFDMLPAFLLQRRLRDHDIGVVDRHHRVVDSGCRNGNHADGGKLGNGYPLGK